MKIEKHCNVFDSASMLGVIPRVYGIGKSNVRIWKRNETSKVFPGEFNNHGETDNKALWWQ